MCGEAAKERITTAYTQVPSNPTVAAGISDGSINFLKCRRSAVTNSVGAASLVQVHFQLECLLGHLWNLESLFFVLAILPSFIFSRSHTT